MMIVETDLHLNPKHPSYNRTAVHQLIAAVQDYAKANIEGAFAVRLVSTRSGEI
ncbi:hypothetical protein [Bradyrhizobium arachidis]|uniref:hypothetical protein n=1 Tax=Bradyrhizobium arachidis TaxID=858423 RepID=UPI002161AE59|nr:hypothetical protein [Bradyrhizobium arachidis]